MLFTSPSVGIRKDIIKLESLKVQACQRQTNGRRRATGPNAGGVVQPRRATAPRATAPGATNARLKYEERLAATRAGKTAARLRADKKRSYQCCAYKVAFRQGNLKGMGPTIARVHAQKVYADAGVTFDKKFPKLE